MIDSKRKFALIALILKRMALYNDELPLKDYIDSFTDLANNPEEELFIIKYVTENLSKSYNMVLDSGVVKSKIARFANQKKEEISNSDITKDVKRKLDSGLQTIKSTNVNELITNFASSITRMINTEELDKEKESPEDPFSFMKNHRSLLEDLQDCTRDMSFSGINTTEDYLKKLEERQNDLEKDLLNGDDSLERLLDNLESMTTIDLKGLGVETDKPKSTQLDRNKKLNVKKIEKCKDCEFLKREESHNQKLPYKATCMRYNRPALFKTSEEIDTIDGRYFGGCTLTKKIN